MISVFSFALLNAKDNPRGEHSTPENNSADQQRQGRAEINVLLNKLNK